MKVGKKGKFRLIFISIFMIGLVSVLVTSVYTDWKAILDNNKKSESLQAEYEAMIKEEKSLESEVTKLKDPEYVARYAKEKYMYSSEGEVIIRMD